MTMLIAHVLFRIPYVILVVSKLRQLNRHIAEAAMDLGLPLCARKIILPEIRPGIISARLWPLPCP